MQKIIDESAEMYTHKLLAIANNSIWSISTVKRANLWRVGLTCQNLPSGRLASEQARLLAD